MKQGPVAYPRDVATDQEDRDEALKSAALKVLVVVLAVALVVGLGTWVMVKALGLDETSSGGPASTVEPVQPLPSTALPVPSESIPSTTETPEVPEGGDGDLTLSASPVSVEAMQRINLTGSWPGQDNTTLAVQRLEGGSWVDFGVQVPVHVGTFATYVMTGRSGENQFRVFDPDTETASNAVTVTVG